MRFLDCCVVFSSAAGGTNSLLVTAFSALFPGALQSSAPPFCAQPSAGVPLSTLLGGGGVRAATQALAAASEAPSIQDQTAVAASRVNAWFRAYLAGDEAGALER